MRVLYTADWHLGKTLRGVSLHEDQADVLDQVFRTVVDEAVELLLIAGDVYDKASPSEAAMKLYSDFLERVHEEAEAAIVVIAGNHDSGQRLGTASKLFDRRRILVRGPIEQDEVPLTLEDSHGAVAISALPYGAIYAARRAFGVEGIRSPEDVLRAQIQAAKAHVPEGVRWIVVAHAFVTNCQPTESERRLSVGTVETISAGIFDGAHYVALGHLHRPQTAGANTIRYSGSPLAFGFDEAGTTKSMTVFDLDGSGQVVDLRAVDFKPLRPVREVRGLLDELVADAKANPSEDYTGAAASADRTELAFANAKAEFAERLGEAGLDEASFEIAKTDVRQCELLEEQINSYNQRVAANKAQLERLAREIGDNCSPDIEALAAAKDTAQSKLESSQQTLTRSKRDLEAKHDTQHKVQALSTRISALEAKYGPVGGLSDLVNGNNDRKVRLPDFAIAAMFDEVLVAANQRLGPMTGGRYQLLRPDDVVGGRQKRGLDIAVFDANTEKSRPTKTLSGGEGFQASLALALGLSDVVQQNSGGIKLDAIFIDEGFGTLDEDTLNTALETLYELTNDKRSVGLISHTEQVKSMITEGFDIEVTPSGSHIRPRRHAA